MEDEHSVNQRTLESSKVVMRGFTFVAIVVAAVRTIVQVIANVDTSSRVLHWLEM